MSPAAESTGVSAKAGAFDTASLFAADKAASAEAATTLATLAKKEGVEFFGVIGLNQAIINVSLRLILCSVASAETGSNLAPIEMLIYRP
jgi:hypothetical protein